MPVSALLLRQFSGLASWPEGALDALAEAAHLRRLTRRQFALSKEEAGNVLAWVIEGSVWLIDHSHDEREVFLGRFGAGDSFGELEAFSAPEPSLESLVYVASGSCSIAVVRRETLEAILTAYPSASLALIRSIASRMTQFLRWKSIIAQASAPVRIVAVLKMLSERNCGIVAAGITQQEIAGYANTTRETVARTMQKLQAEGAVTREEVGWRIDLAALELSAAFKAASEG